MLVAKRWNNIIGPHYRNRESDPLKAPQQYAHLLKYAQGYKTNRTRKEKKNKPGSTDMGRRDPLVSQVGYEINDAASCVLLHAS